MRKLLAVSAVATLLATTAAYSSSVEDTIKDTTFSATALSGPFDFTLEGNRDGASELEIGYTGLEHSFDGVDAALRFALGTDLRGTDSLYGRAEYIFGSKVGDVFVYGIGAVQYTTNTKLQNGVWTFEPSLGATYGLSETVSIFGEVGYVWELNRDRRDLGGFVEVGLPIAVNDSFYVTPSVSRTFNTGSNQTNAHLNLTYRF